MAQYERFLRKGDFDEIYYFTYDSRDDERLAQLKRNQGAPQNLYVLTPPRFLCSRIGAIIYSIVGPLMHGAVLSQVDVMKTQQVSGSWTALISKLIFRKPLLFRLGYPLSLRFKDEGRPIKYALARIVEHLLTRFANHVAVTSRTMQSYYGRPSNGTAVTVLPSYVDVSAFTPITVYDPAKPILYVGRLEPEKNVAGLIEACGKIGVPLEIYGTGSLRGDLEALARSCGARVTFHGVLPNSELARAHHNHTIFALSSPREGMPKALIEAMASGLVCIGTRTEGIVELIEDGVTGHLIDGTDADAIARTLRAVIDNLDPEVGRRASEFVRTNNSLEHAAEMELAILEKISATPQRSLPVRTVQN